MTSLGALAMYYVVQYCTHKNVHLQYCTFLWVQYCTMYYVVQYCTHKNVHLPCTTWCSIAPTKMCTCLVLRGAYCTTHMCTCHEQRGAVLYPHICMCTCHVQRGAVYCTDTYVHLLYTAWCCIAPTHVCSYPIQRGAVLHPDLCAPALYSVVQYCTHTCVQCWNKCRSIIKCRFLINNWLLICLLV